MFSCEDSTRKTTTHGRAVQLRRGAGNLLRSGESAPQFSGFNLLAGSFFKRRSQSNVNKSNANLAPAANESAIADLANFVAYWRRDRSLPIGIRKEL